MKFVSYEWEILSITLKFEKKRRKGLSITFYVRNGRSFQFEIPCDFISEAAEVTHDEATKTFSLLVAPIAAISLWNYFFPGFWSSKKLRWPKNKKFRRPFQRKGTKRVGKKGASLAFSQTIRRHEWGAYYRTSLFPRYRCKSTSEKLTPYKSGHFVRLSQFT